MPNPPARGRRFFSASDEEIVAGRTTDVYFARTMEILKSKGKMRERALAEFTVGALPHGWPWAVMCGVEEALRLFEGKHVSIHGLPEGTIFKPRSHSGIRIPVMTIEGPYSEYCVYETPALGFLCHSTGVATMSAHARLAAKGTVLLSFGVRRMHPAISPMLDRSAFIGGCDSVSSVLGAELIGEEPSGTMPHALVVMFGDQRLAFKAFDEVVDPKVPRVALVDTYSDEKAEAIMAAEAMKDLYAVRLDTPASRRGSMADLVREVRWELDVRGFNKVRIFVSGGLDDRSIPELVAAGADGFGVGTSICNAPTVDFALDIVEREGRPVAKRGKLGGRKYAYRCEECLEWEVFSSTRRDPPCPRCGSKMQLAEKELMTNGKRTVEPASPRAIRERVLQQLVKLGA
ncbi:MAG TPA: nicotinate phosphoribosyltransferase [Methanomassiliicoccales archaeon]|nr:nicotinate phosphoribosyltransferase [Methanomassiliicoccales archaeon]